MIRIPAANIVALATLTPWYTPVYRSTLRYTPLSKRSATKTTAENAANGQNLFQNSSGTAPSNRKSRATTSDSRTMSASTSIAATRRTPDDETSAGSLNLFRRAPIRVTPRLIEGILERIGDLYLYVTPLADDPGQKRHKEAQAQDQNAPAQESRKRTARGEESREPGEDGEGEVDVAHLPVLGRVGCDPLIDVLPVSGEDILASRRPPHQRERRVEEARRKDSRCNHEGQVCTVGGVRSTHRLRVQRCRPEKEPHEVTPRIAQEDPGRADVPQHEPGYRRRKGRKPDLEPRRSDERRQENGVQDRRPTGYPVYPVHEVVGVHDGYDPDHAEEKRQGPQGTGGLADRRRRQKQENKGRRRLSGGLHPELEVYEVVEDADEAREGRGGEKEKAPAHQRSDGPHPGDDGEAAEPRGGYLVGAAGVRHVEQVPADGEPHQQGNQGERYQKRHPNSTRDPPGHGHHPTSPISRSRRTSSAIPSLKARGA